MKNIRILSGALSLLLIITLFAGCTEKEQGCYEFSMGEGLPVWKFSEPRQKVLPDENSDKNLIAAYKTDSSHADVYVYEYEKQGVTTESMAKAEAEKLGVNVASVKDKGVDAKTYIGFEKSGEKAYINQVYFYEGSKKIVKICVKYKTDELKLADTDYTFCLPAGYKAERKTDPIFEYCCEYTPESEYLPVIKIRKFAKDYFTSKTYDLSKVTGITAEEYDNLAKDGWTLEEEIEYYKKTRELDRGEIMHRGGKDIAFISFFSGDILKVRAVIDCGSDFAEICIEQKKDEFRHITTAIIDSIVVPESSQSVPGGWQASENKEITAELTEIFNSAFSGFTGASYTPKELLETQVVAGINYKFLCDKRIVTPGAEVTEAIVVIYKNLQGKCSVISIEER